MKIRAAALLVLSSGLFSMLTALLATADDRPGSSRPRDIARRFAGLSFPERTLLEGPWRPDPGSRRILQLARQALFERDGFLKEEVRMGEEHHRAVAEALLSVVEWSGGRSAEAYHLLAALCHRQGDRRQALCHAARAVVLEPFSSRYHSNLGFFLQAARRYGEARVLYEEARHLDRDNTAAHIGLLSLSLHGAEIGLAEMGEIATDWLRRERDPALRPAARASVEALSSLPEKADSREGDLPELQRIRAALAALFQSHGS